ncbi:uncharacterized protein LOC111342521 [Stylophora pistillata]|uniref:uncharacterized protein LOC111342521 n=1 Tax=Stylophora pistillata TaxID=50429 RepID=UPI000C03D856|nr:uncharacterized protein LOC111342521 [Stylophora pistillata]
MIFQTFLNWALCFALIFASKTFGKRSSPEDVEIDILQPNVMAKRERFWYKPFRQTKRDEENLSEVRCGPHPKIVPVEDGEGNALNIPQFVWVNRCQGACNHALAWEKCTSTKNRTIDVIMKTSGSGKRTLPVIEHVKCKCQCHVQCNATVHERDVGNCRCNCKTKCNDDENQELDTCACVPRNGKRNFLYQIY